MSNFKFCKHLFVMSMDIKATCFNSLQLHCRKAVYQSHVWRKCLVANPEILTLIGNGWELDEDNSICIKWDNVNSTLDEVPELIFSTCPWKWVRDTCRCVDSGLPCLDTSPPAITCSKLTTETLEQKVKYVQR